MGKSALGILFLLIFMVATASEAATSTADRRHLEKSPSQKKS